MEKEEQKKKEMKRGGWQEEKAGQQNRGKGKHSFTVILDTEEKEGMKTEGIHFRNRKQHSDKERCDGRE